MKKYFLVLSLLCIGFVRGGTRVDFVTDGLIQPVFINGVETSFDQYCQMVGKEHLDSYAYFTSNEVEWSVPDGLADKVQSSGRLRKYHGNTVVFPLSTKEKEALLLIQQELRKSIGFLARPLSSDYFHLTLHDLFHGKRLSRLHKKIEASNRKARVIFKQLKKILAEHPEQRYVDLLPSKVMPSVNTSMVLAYLPKTEKDYKILFNLFALFDSINVLPYFLRPHVTLDYFAPNPPSKLNLEQLKMAMLNINSKVLPSLKLDVMQLSYQLFSSMDDYETLFVVNK